VATKHGRRIAFWGQVRPGGRHEVTIERRAGRRWTRVARARTTARGYWRRRVASRAGIYRYRWGSRAARTSDSIRIR
jgi:hypothetical protein